MLIKKVILVLITLFFVNTTFADSYQNEDKNTNFIVTPSIAYRYDVFKWAVSSNKFPQKKLSELIWKNHIIQPEIKFEIEPKANQFTILGQVKYGYILRNQSKSWDYDWYSTKKTSELTSKTKSSVRGNILDLSGAIGYSVNLLTFYVGYDYTDYKNKNYGCFQLLDFHDVSVSSNQLVQKYYFKTKTPWLGLSIKGSITDKFQIVPTIKFYSFNYIGKGYWLLRDDFEQNPSFKHNAKGKGLGFDVDFLYKHSENLDFKINLETKKLKMTNGKDRMYFSKKEKKSALFNIGEKVENNNKFYSLSLISSSISVGLIYKL